MSLSCIHEAKLGRRRQRKALRASTGIWLDIVAHLRPASSGGLLHRMRRIPHTRQLHQTSATAQCTRRDALARPMSMPKDVGEGMGTWIRAKLCRSGQPQNLVRKRLPDAAAQLQMSATIVRRAPSPIKLDSHWDDDLSWQDRNPDHAHRQASARQRRRQARPVHRRAPSPNSAEPLHIQFNTDSTVWDTTVLFDASIIDDTLATVARV